jgi:hypothetical protein
MDDFMDPLASGDDGLSLIDSSGSDDGSLGSTTGSTDPSNTTTGQGFFNPSSNNPVTGFGGSPANGLSGTTTPSSGGILSSLAGLFGAGAKAIAAATSGTTAQPGVLTSLGLTNPTTGQLTTTGWLAIAGGAALLFMA